MKRNAKIGPTTEKLCWKSLRFFFFGIAIFPNSVGKTRKQFLKRLQSKRPSVLLAFILREMKNYWFSEKIAVKWWELSTSKERVQRAKVWFRRVAADCAAGLIRSANMLLRGLHLRTALGSPTSRMRQEFNESSQYRESSLSFHKIITFLWDQAPGKPKPKG